MLLSGKITAKGQTTIPAEIRTLLGVGPGDHLEYVLGDDGAVRIRRARTFADLRGMLTSDARLTGDELDVAIDDAWDARAAEIMARSKR